MSELYLIAHKVSGEAAFDVALRMDCPECEHGTRSEETDMGWEEWPCGECDGLGYWWIIPTSGHRAYPYDYKELEWDELSVGQPPEGLQDHYQHGPTPKVDIRALLKSNQPQRPTMTRRL
jgi:hypothetical protein